MKDVCDFREAIGRDFLLGLLVDDGDGDVPMPQRKAGDTTVGTGANEASANCHADCAGNPRNLLHEFPPWWRKETYISRCSVMILMLRLTCDQMSLSNTTLRGQLTSGILTEVSVVRGEL
jgi:hypothetical protein